MTFKMHLRNRRNLAAPGCGRRFLGNSFDLDGLREANFIKTETFRELLARIVCKTVNYSKRFIVRDD